MSLQGYEIESFNLVKTLYQWKVVRQTCVSVGMIIPANYQAKFCALSLRIQFASAAASAVSAADCALNSIKSKSELLFLYWGFILMQVQV